MASSFMCNVSLPLKLDIHSGNFSKEWKQWRHVWDAYGEVTDLRNKASHLRISTFITYVGMEALEVHNGLSFASEDEKSDWNKILELWEAYCIGKTNIICETYKYTPESKRVQKRVSKQMQVLGPST